MNDWIYGIATYPGQIRSCEITPRFKGNARFWVMFPAGPVKLTLQPGKLFASRSIWDEPSEELGKIITDDIWVNAGHAVYHYFRETSNINGIQIDSVGVYMCPVGNLHDMIEDTGLHPITCLTMLSGTQKKNLMEKGVVLCRNVREGGAALAAAGLSAEEIAGASKESQLLCPVE